MSHVTRLLWKYCVREQKLSPESKDAEDRLRSILPGLLYTSITINHRLIPSQFALNKPLSSFHTYHIYGTVRITIDSSITCLNTPPEGRLALSHSQPCRQGQLQCRSSEMCRWYDKEGESSDLAVTGGGKQKPLMILQAILPGLLTFKQPILFPKQNTRELVQPQRWAGCEFPGPLRLSRYFCSRIAAVWGKATRGRLLQKSLTAVPMNTSVR